MRCKFLEQINQLWLNLFYKFARTKIYYINGPDTLPAPLTREEEEEVFTRLLIGDENAKQELIVHNLRLVVYIIREETARGPWEQSSHGPRFLFLLLTAPRAPACRRRGHLR